jgi:site-specific recombinase XerD
MVPLNNNAVLALKNYLKVREKAENNNLFLNRFGETLRDIGVQKMLRKYLKHAGIGSASIHTLRHTFGAYHLANGMNLKQVKELMGHRDSRSTAVYQSLAENVVGREIISGSL